MPSEFLGWVPTGGTPADTISSSAYIAPQLDDPDCGSQQWKSFQEETGTTSVMEGRVRAADIERMLAPLLRHMRVGNGAATTLIVICGPPAFASNAEKILLDEVGVTRESLCRLD